MRHIALLLAVVGCNVASASETRSPGQQPASHEAAKSAKKSPKKAPPASSATAKPSSSATAVPAASAEPRKKGDASPACPSDMVEIKGKYCSEVEHECKRSWYDESNKKTICELFEPKAKCVGTETEKHFCIDRYTWPNVKGARPEIMNNFYQAQVKCAAVGKRICGESEWTMACEGPERKPFPYGFERDTTKCNGDRPWDSPDMKKVAQRDQAELKRLWQGVRNGSQPECTSDYGVEDLPGNTDEVVFNEQAPGSHWDRFSSVHSGGPWYKGVRNQCRPKIYTHDEGFYYYFLSFRCCEEPSGEENNLLTPRQKREGWNFQRVERTAGFTREEVREALEKKKKGQCTCEGMGKGTKWVRCATLCGVLLPEDAEDVELGKPTPKRKRGAAAD